jgi:predicted PurR-regulated permease PerM
MNNNVAQRIFFGLLLVVVTIAFLWLIRAFLQPIFWAVALGIVFYPLHQRLNKLLGNRPRLAAATSVIAIVLIVVLPLAAVITAMATEAAALVERIRTNEIDLQSAIVWGRDQVPLVARTLESIPGIELDRLTSQLSSMAVTSSQFLASRAVSLGQDTIRVAVYFFLMLYLLFFFMRDGTTILDGLVRALPFGDARERHLLERFAQVSRATIKGTLVVGVVQGLIGGVLFWAVGFHAPVLWGVVMALLSIIPAVGPSLVWIPAAIILLVQGFTVDAADPTAPSQAVLIWKGIAVIIVGALVIGLADNLLRPILVGRDTRMPDYLILLSTLGGLLGFGLAGIVIGPIIAAFFLSVWEMAEEEYSDDKPTASSGDGTEQEIDRPGA